MNVKRTSLIIVCALVFVGVVALMRVAAVPRTEVTIDGVALVNRQSISKAEFRSYIKASISRRHFAVGGVDVGQLEEMLNGYIEEQILVYQDAARQGLFADKDFQRAYEFGENQLIARRYIAGELQETLEVTEDDLSEYIPSEWVSLKLRQILLSNRGEAEAVLAKARAGEDFIELVREYSIGPGAARDGDLGNRFPGSGYFLPAYDVYLFSLEAGEISDVVETPLGPAICKVEERKVYSEHEIKAMLRKPRNMIFSRKVQTHIREIREKVGAEIYADPLNECVAALDGGRKHDALIAKAGEREFYFMDLQRTIGVPYDRIYIEPSVDKLFQLYRDNIDSKISDYVLAQEARILGVSIETDAEKMELTKLKRRVALRMMGERIFAGLDVTDEEAREYFEEKPDEFNIPERVRLWQILLADEPTAKLVHEKLMAEESFEELAREYSIDKRKGSLSGLIGTLQKKDLEEELADAAFALLPGDYSDIIQTEHGYHILKVDGTYSARTFEFEDIKGIVRKAVLRGKQEERFAKYIQDLFAKAVIEINDEALRELIAEMKNRKPGTSPHGAAGMPINSPGASPHGPGGMPINSSGASPHGAN